MNGHIFLDLLVHDCRKVESIGTSDQNDQVIVFFDMSECKMWSEVVPNEGIEVRGEN
jgi:hypothetical protein